MFLPETTPDLSLNLPNTERDLSSDSSTGLSLSFRSSVDSIFTLDQEEYLEAGNDNEKNTTNQMPITIIHKRIREQTYTKEEGKSPTPTKYYKLLEENKKIVDGFKNN
tara:strand:- start:3395 stop:3718 length:324 start_codon:yes stop_codon:yes gene_type:complete